MRVERDSYKWSEGCSIRCAISRMTLGCTSRFHSSLRSKRFSGGVVRFSLFERAENLGRESEKPNKAHNLTQCNACYRGLFQSIFLELL